MSATWWVVVPVKDARRGKSRLAGVLDDDSRARLVRAMALDTVAAARSAARVLGVVLVTPDPVLAEAARAVGVHVVPEPDPAPGAPAGLDAAVLAGAAHVHATSPRAHVAALLGDLPRLDPRDLDDALALAGRSTRAHVADAEGTGTTMLTARSGAPLRPAFGTGSSARHAAAGHVLLDVPLGSTLRHDVDLPADLDTLADPGA